MRLVLDVLVRFFNGVRVLLFAAEVDLMEVDDLSVEKKIGVVKLASLVLDFLIVVTNDNVLLDTFVTSVVVTDFAATGNESVLLSTLDRIVDLCVLL